MWVMVIYESFEYWLFKNYDVFIIVFLYKIEVIYLCICFV